jgi:hypothetical protein
VPGEPGHESQHPTLAERVAALEATSRDDRVADNDLLSQLRQQFDLIDRQMSNPNESAAGRAILERLGRAERVAAKLVTDVDGLETWRKGLLDEIRATFRVFRVIATVVAGATGLIVTALGILWSLHQLGIVR